MLKIIIILISLSFATNIFSEDLSTITSFKISEHLINQNKKNKMLSTQADPNLMYNEIYQYLNGQHQKLGQTLTDNILKLNRGFDLGQQNFNGITWQKPFANFSIGVNRQLSPDLFDINRWIVDDTFTIYIDAATYLSNLKDAQEITITDSQLAAFVGISFKRTYRYLHFAESFNLGLASDYNKLFMTFWNMRKGNIYDLEQYEIMGREDSLSFKSGGMITSPTAGTININGGILATMTKLSKLQIQSVGPLDNPKPDEFLRVSSEKENIIKVTAQAKLQADFFKLLKITLLSYDTTYSYDEIDRKYFSFKKSDLSSLKSEIESSQELDNLINLKKFNLVHLLPFQTQGEFRMEENFSSKYSVLLWGGEAVRGSQTILVNRGNEQKSFIVHKSKSVRFTENVGSKLAGIILAAIFQSDQIIGQYLESYTRQIELEFEANRAALDGSQYDQVREIQDADKLSIKITKEYKTRKTFKKNSDWQKSSDHNKAVDFVKNMSSLNIDIINSLDKGELHSPLSITATLRLEKEAIIYFNQQKNQTVLDTLNELCKISELEKDKQDYCFKMLEGKYNAYIVPFLDTGKMNIPRLKDFLYSFNNQYDDVSFYKKLFGSNLVFSSGQIEASRDNGLIYTTYFHNGEFRGLGVIDNYVRQVGPGMPAPIFNYLE